MSLTGTWTGFPFLPYWSVCVALDLSFSGGHAERLENSATSGWLSPCWDRVKVQNASEKQRNKKQTPNQPNKKQPHPTKTHPNLSLPIGLYWGVESLSAFKANTWSCPDFLRHKENELPKETLYVIMEKNNNLVLSVKASLICITLPDCCKPIFTSQLMESLCWTAGSALWNWAFNFHGKLPGLKWSEWDENLQWKNMVPSAFSQREMESLPATAGAARSKIATKMGITTILKKVSRKAGMHPPCGVPPSLHWLQEKHK